MVDVVRVGGPRLGVHRLGLVRRQVVVEGDVVAHPLDLHDGRDRHRTDRGGVRHRVVVLGLGVDLLRRRLAVDPVLFVADDGLAVLGAVPENTVRLGAA